MVIQAYERVRICRWQHDTPHPTTKVGVQQRPSLMRRQRADLVRKITLIPDLPARVLAHLLASRATGPASEDDDVAVRLDLGFPDDLLDGRRPERLTGTALPGRRRAVIVGAKVVDSL